MPITKLSTTLRGAFYSEVILLQQHTNKQGTGAFMPMDTMPEVKYDHQKIFLFSSSTVPEIV